ncbi:Amino-acid acetyltransferase, mitochondrial [Pseudocyphellaria aurata]|nr:Amino-acid acetyltransferase, mitochondrial [Pseudocyphellaria aurata]
MQDLFLDVLGSTATKREARAYLSRFSPPEAVFQPQKITLPKNKLVGVNLGNLKLPPRAVDESPVFTQAVSNNRFVDQSIESLHVALVTIRAPQLLDDAILQGVGHTLSQLTRLGLNSAVVIDCADREKRHSLDACRVALEQGDRLVTAIDLYRDRGARRLDSVIGLSSVREQNLSSCKARGRLQITHRNLILAPLRRGVTPIIVPIAFSYDTHALVPVVADEVVLCLAQELLVLKPQGVFEEDLHKVTAKVKCLQKQISLDRIILLDSLGGIPSRETVHGSHVFINLEQEYRDIRDALQQSAEGEQHLAKRSSSSENLLNQSCSISPGSVFGAKGCNSCLAPGNGELLNRSTDYINARSHLRNLNLLKRTLEILPASSSAIIITPQEAANSGRSSELASQSLGVGTRRQKNPLIYNLLTDKPVVSSSLPSCRSQKNLTSILHSVSKPSPATFVKRGIPISIIPDPNLHPWTPPTSSPSIQLPDPRIDLTRLVHLIENSFSRKLDVDHYLSRINNRIAGVIIAGEYEGGALLTWEIPPGSPSSPAVPYLDKFAVLKRSQGAGGVADIVFKALVRDCFPNGVCWRSRKDNPVNKWYFERATGTWKIPRTSWTMFWTTEGVDKVGSTFLDYERVCTSVVPSWADKNSVVD